MERVRIAHLSDPHFGTVVPEVQEGLLRDLRAQAPHLVVLSGDITQRARCSQFAAARKFILDLHPTPVLVVPGNHDIPLFNWIGRAFWPYRGFQSLRHPVETHVDVGECRIWGMNSTRRWRHVQGSLSQNQARKKPWENTSVRIVVVHHPFVCAKAIDTKNLLRGRDSVYPIFEEMRVDLVLSGHIHDPYMTLSNTHFSGAQRPLLFSVAGTCLSWRTRAGAPNSYGLVEIEPQGEARITMERRDWVHGAFRPHSRESYCRPEGQGWRSVLI